NDAALRIRSGSVIHGVDRDRQRDGGGVLQAVVGSEGEAVRTVVVGGGRIGYRRGAGTRRACAGHRAGGGERGSVGGIGDDRVGEYVAIRVGRRERDRKRGVFVGGNGLRAGNRGCIHGNREGARSAGVDSAVRRAATIFEDHREGG